MHIENFHRKMKHIYLEGMQCSRLDKAINALFEIIRDTMYERNIKIAKRKSLDKILRI